MQRISPEEIDLLKNPLTRPAYFARNRLPQGTLEIRERVFGGERGLLRGADIDNVRFVNCVFDLFQGYDNNLTNVVFEECQFFGGVFTGPKWKNVKLTRCEAEGPFQIGCADGDVSFEECRLTGMTAKEGGYGNWSDHFGLATGQNGSTTFLACAIKNVDTGGAKSLRLLDCDIGDLYANCQSRRGELVIERCRAKGRHDFSSGDSDFSRITIKDSQLGSVNLGGASSDLVEISNSSMSLEMGSPYYGEIRLFKSSFHTEGFACQQSFIGSLVIDSCQFSSQGDGLQLYGELNRRPDPGEGPVYWARRRDMVIRNTIVPKAKLDYMKVINLTLEDASLRDTDLSHCCIDSIHFRNARLEGELNLEGTTIRRIETQNLTNLARLKGELKANPAAPYPDIEPGKPIRK